MSIETPRVVGGRRPTIITLDRNREPESFAEQVRRGLSASPKTLPCQFFYDEEGSRLFEEICALAEYYPTRTEDSILRDHAAEFVSGFASAPAMVELGSGSSTKTRRLIEACLETYEGLLYVPIDVSPTILEQSARELIGDYNALRVVGYAADYRVALESARIRSLGPKLLVFLGSSLGNYEPAEAIDLLRAVAAAMGPADRLLLGTDLIKDRMTLETAYDDARGVTAAFNLNLLHRINRELGGDFDPGRFLHRATFNEALGRVEMHLISRGDQSIRVEAAGLDVEFRDGESIHTENSHKYTPTRLADMASRAGFVEETARTDPGGLFRVQRWRPATP